MKELNLGKIPNPWEYFDDVSGVTFKNSVEAYHFFCEKTGSDGQVILAFCKTKHPEHEDILCWMYSFEKDGHKVAVASVFVDDVELMKHIIPGQFNINKEYIVTRNDGTYEAVVTTNSEVVIKKIKGVFSEEKAKLLLKMKNFDVADIYPVEICTLNTDAPICICWSISLKDNPDTALWFPVSSEDVAFLDVGENKGLIEIPLELYKTVTIGGDKFTLHSNNELGKYFIPEGKGKGKSKPNFIPITPKRNKYTS